MNENAAALTLSAAKSAPSGKHYNPNGTKDILLKAKSSLAQSGKLHKDFQGGKYDHSQTAQKADYEKQIAIR